MSKAGQIQQGKGELGLSELRIFNSNRFQNFENKLLLEEP